MDRSFAGSVMLSQAVVKVVVLILLKLLTECFVDVDCRRVTHSVENIEIIVKGLNDVNLGAIDNAGPPCLLDVQRDLPMKNTPQPLYVIPDTNKFWLPNLHGQLEVPRGAAIELYCTKSFANATVNNNGTATINNSTIEFTNLFQIAKNTKMLQPRCLHDKMFFWAGKKYELQQFICEQSPKYTVEKLCEKCPNLTDHQASMKAQMYRVGFNISDGRFLETMRICYDDSLLRTLYVKHKLLPASIYFQKFIKRLHFSKAGHFKDVNMNHLYSQYSQRQKAAALLKGQHDHLFDNSSLFLARGHLAAKSDFIYTNQQRATFNFFNVAPQWQTFNGGQWATLEDEVRKFVARSKLQVICYTGTYGTLQLTYTSGEGSVSDNTATTPAVHYRDFYLTMDNNNNGILPVPKLFYRILIDSSRHPSRGIALIGVNNPHATLSQINASYIICDDIHNQVAWLRWMHNKNLKKGFLYACRVSDFAIAIGSIPKSLLNITDILY